MYGYDENDHLATPTEACREWAWNVGEDFPDRQWLLTDYDTWERNPHYHGPAQEHPYDAEARQDADLADESGFEDFEYRARKVRETVPYVAPVDSGIDEDIPF